MISKIVWYWNNKNLLLYTIQGAILHWRIDPKYGVKGASWLEQLVKDSTSLLRLTDIIEVKHLWDRQRNILPVSENVEVLSEIPIPYEIWE